MTIHLTRRDDLERSLANLPAESLDEVSQFVEYLQFKAAHQPRPIVRLGGLWKNYEPITDEDIAQARREMWGHVGERDL